jgi:hypothetical protein
MKPMKQVVNIGHVIIFTVDVMVFGCVKMVLTKRIVHLPLVLNIIIVVFFQMTLRMCHVYRLLEPVMVLMIVLVQQMNEQNII